MDIKLRFTGEPYEIERHGCWIDLRATKDYAYAAGQQIKVGLGVNIAVPEGYEGMLAARSSTFEKHGLIQTNAVGIIEPKYSGNDDEWIFSGYALQDGVIKAGDRICQFRVHKAMDEVSFNIVDDMGNDNRGGFGSTGQ